MFPVEVVKTSVKALIIRSGQAVGRACAPIPLLARVHESMGQGQLCISIVYDFIAKPHSVSQF